MGDLTGFVLAGHSFGGFVSGHYTCRYPQHVKKLLMLSPFGVPKRTFTDAEFGVLYDKMESTKGHRKPPKFVFKIWKKAFEKRWSPFGIFRKSPECMQNRFLMGFVRNRIKGDVP